MIPLAGRNVQGLPLGSSAYFLGGGAPVKPDLTSWAHYWKFDDASGTTVADLGTSTLNGTLANRSGSGLPLWVSGYYGSALEFAAAGGTNVVGLGSNTLNTLGTGGASFTIAMQLTSDVGQVVGKYGSLFHNNDYNGSGDQNGFRCSWDYNGTGLVFNIANGASTVTNLVVPHATAGVSASVNCVLGFVFDNAGNEIRIYSGSSNVGSAAFSANVAYRTSEQPSIGHASDPTNTTNSVWGFDGVIDWCAVDTVAYNDAAWASFYAGLSL